MSHINYLELSKAISYALRHAPWEYELELDENGGVSAEQLLIALNESDKWENVTLEDLEHMIENSDKKRHELVEGRIRAIYGHSIPKKIIKKSTEPFACIFLPEVADVCIKKGIKNSHELIKIFKERREIFN